MTTMRLQMLRTTPSSWVMMTMVTPSSALIFFKSASTLWVVSASNALVGSSHSSTLGLVARARARATRCFWPPESWLG